MIRMIVAVDQGNAIGWSDGRLPWKLPADMARFKELTTGGRVVMGFNTFKSLNRPEGLPNRENLVLTRKTWQEARDFIGNNVDVISNLNYLGRYLHIDGVIKTLDYWVIGGASVYAEALEKDMVDEIYITQVHVPSEADVRLTTDLYSWKLFVLRQRKIGVQWEPVLMSEPDLPVGHLPISYVVLKRIR